MACGPELVNPGVQYGPHRQNRERWTEEADLRELEGGGDVEEVRQIRRGTVVDGLECKQEDFEV